MIDTLVAVGKSDALTAKLRELEQQKRKLAQQKSAAVPVLLTGVADQWRELVTNLENLGRFAKPDEMETARTLLQDLIGEVSVTEEGDGVFAYTRLSNGAGYNDGAEERT